MDWVVYKRIELIFTKYTVLVGLMQSGYWEYKSSNDDIRSTLQEVDYFYDSLRQDSPESSDFIIFYIGIKVTTAPSHRQNNYFFSVRDS